MELTPSEITQSEITQSEITGNDFNRHIWSRLLLGDRTGLSPTFWCYPHISGLYGGHFENPCYLDVLARITGHAEVAQIEYNPAKISYETLLETFWQIHDPTSFNRQGADRGEQYRSVIFYHTDEQKQLAHQSKQSMANRYPKPIVTTIVTASAYWLATEEHQQYFEKKTTKKLL